MNTKDLAIHIIAQELRFTQLYVKLQELGMEPEEYSVSMMEVIQPLISFPYSAGIEFPEVEEEFACMYTKLMFKVRDFPNLTQTKELWPLAESCYHQLLAHLEDHNKTKA